MSVHFKNLLFSCCVLLSFWFLPMQGLAAPQEAVISVQGGQVIQQLKVGGSMSAEQKKAMMEMQKKASEGKDRRSKGKEKDGEEKEKDEKPGEEKKDKEGKGKDESKTVTRPDKPKKPADPVELEVLPDDDSGMILNFHGHSWPDMIDWYSRASGREIEWRELPKGYVNLRTNRKFTTTETADVLNRLLLARGFTMLDDVDFLTIEKTEGINQAIVPRVQPNRLHLLSPYSFVRTSFRVTRVKAANVVKELESLKSKNGKLTALSASNRIDAIDSVRNLQEIYQALDEEETSGKHAPQEFVLKYVRAATVRKKLEEMLGSASNKPKQPMNPQQMQEMQRRMQQQREQNKGKPQAPAAAAEEKISMVVNEVNNSIIVKAPPHRMADIAETIEYLDIPNERGGLDNYVDRVKTYRFATLNPEEVKSILEETAGLDPTTTIRVDKASKSLIASAPPWDHMIIARLTTKLDGSLRQFKVIPLKRLRAIQVSTTIETMMGEPKDESNNRRRYWWDEEKDDDKEDKFRVGADTEYNRLLLKCNDTEYETVLSLLEQLGEVTNTSQVRSRTRIFEASTGENEDAFLRRVQAAFEAMGMDNEIVLPTPAAKKEQPKVEDDSDQRNSREVVPSRDVIRTERSTNLDVTETKDEFARFQTTYVQVEETRVAVKEGSSVSKTATPAPRKKPPIVIQRDADGKLVLRSDDPKALDVFEELMRQMAPEQEDWVVFKLKTVTAFWMKLQLEEFFEEEEEQSPFIWGWWEDDRDDSPPGLGDEPQLKFIDDGESTLVVRNATAKQLATITRLVELYDVSEPPNAQNARFKELIPIRHSKARTIENALKEAFRDLLSSNDKAFGNPNPQNGEKESGRRSGFPFGLAPPTTGIGGSTFKGKLSFGVDESTNILIVTAEGQQLLDVVIEMVQQLDRAAQPTDETRVVSTPETLNAGNLKESLTRMFGPESVVTRQAGKEGEQAGEQQEAKPEGGGRRGRRGGGGGNAVQVRN